MMKTFNTQLTDSRNRDVSVNMMERDDTVTGGGCVEASISDGHVQKEVKDSQKSWNSWKSWRKVGKNVMNIVTGEKRNTRKNLRIREERVEGFSEQKCKTIVKGSGVTVDGVETSSMTIIKTDHSCPTEVDHVVRDAHAARTKTNMTSIQHKRRHDTRWGATRLRTKPKFHNNGSQLMSRFTHTLEGTI